MTILTRAMSLFMPKLAQSLARDLGFIDVTERRKERRAAIVPERPLQARRLSVRAYRRMVSEFHDLSLRAADPNPHMSPAAVCAAADTLMASRDLVILAAIEPGDGIMADSLMGVWVLKQGQDAWALGARTLVSPIVPDYEVLSTPVVDTHRAQEAMLVMMKAIAADDTLPGLIYLPSMPLEGVTASALKAALHARIARMDAFETWPRAVMLAGLDADGPEHLRRAMPNSIRRREKQRRALDREGGLRFDLVPGSDSAAFDRFLDLEAMGWKGEAGTALKSLPGHADYIRAVIEENAAHGEGFIAEMRAGQRLVASGLLIGSAGVWHFLKSAFDPDLAKHSPGVLINMEVTKALHAMPGFRALDSGMDDSSDADSQVWADRRAMGRALIDLGASPKGRLTAEMLAVRRSLRALKNRR